MARVFKFTALHNGEPIGIIEDGAIEHSRERNDDAIFWYAMAARRRPPARLLPVSPAWQRHTDQA